MQTIVDKIDRWELAAGHLRFYDGNDRLYDFVLKDTSFQTRNGAVWFRDLRHALRLTAADMNRVQNVIDSSPLTVNKLELEFLNCYDCGTSDPPQSFYADPSGQLYGQPEVGGGYYLVP